jgi:hypothetical protein
MIIFGSGAPKIAFESSVVSAICNPGKLKISSPPKISDFAV